MKQQKRNSFVFGLKTALVFVLSLVLLLPSLPIPVQAADEVNIKLNVPYINQNDYTTTFKDTNGNTVYNNEGQKSTVQISGCGAASSAMVIRFYKNNNISPNTLFQRAIDHKYYIGEGLTHEAVYNICAQDAVNVSWTNDVNSVITSLKNDRPVIANVVKQPFTSEAHYIVIIGYKKKTDGSEYFLVNDPNHPELCNQEFTKAKIIDSLTTKAPGFGITSYNPYTGPVSRPSMESTQLKLKQACNINGYAASNVKITNVTGQIFRLTGSNNAETLVDTVDDEPNTTFYDLRSSKINMNLKFGSLSDGKYKLLIRITDENNKSISGYVIFYVGSGVTPGTDTTSTLKISSLSLDANPIKQGSGCNINGTISSNNNITKVTGQFINSSGTPVQEKNDKPNKKSYDIKSSIINTELKFGSLAPGQYTLKITAEDGKKAVTSSYNFTISPTTTPSTLTISSLALASNPITEGNGCNISGTISSNYEISEVTGQFINSNGSTVQTKTDKPNKKSYDIKSSVINSQLKFGSLAPGQYTLKITAKDSQKTVSKTYSFTIQSKNKISGNVSMDTTSLARGKGCNITGTLSSGSRIKKVTGKIFNSSNKELQSRSYEPYSKSVDLKSSPINTYLKFGQLAKGSYQLRISATNEAGNTYNKTIAFTVK